MLTSMHHCLDDTAIQQSLDKLALRHKPVVNAIKKVGYPKVRARELGFPAFAKIIIAQQLSVAAATTISTRLEKALNGNVEASKFLALSEESSRAIGLSQQKSAYLRDLATAFCSGDFIVEALTEMADQEVVDRITSFRGLGEWSAHMYLIFSMGRPDVWPAGDLGVRIGLGRLLDLKERPSIVKVRQLGREYLPFRSAMALLCWRCCQLDL